MVAAGSVPGGARGVHDDALRLSYCDSEKRDLRSDGTKKILAESVDSPYDIG